MDTLPYVYQRHDKLCKLDSILLGQVPGLSVIDQAQTPVIQQEDVARMAVAVEEAVNKYLRRKRVMCECLSITIEQQ